MMSGSKRDGAGGTAWRRPKIPRLQERIDSFKAMSVGFSHANGWLSGPDEEEEEQTVHLAGPFPFHGDVFPQRSELLFWKRSFGLFDSHKSLTTVVDDTKKQFSVALKLREFRKEMHQFDPNGALRSVHQMLLADQLMQKTCPPPLEKRGTSRFECDTADVDVDVLGRPKVIADGIIPFPHQLSMAALALRQFDRGPAAIDCSFSPEWAKGIVFSAGNGAWFGNATTPGKILLPPALLDTSDVGNGKTGSVILFVAAMAERSIEQRLSFFQRAHGVFYNFNPASESVR